MTEHCLDNSSVSAVMPFGNKKKSISNLKMEISSPFQRIQELISLIELSPSLEQLVKFLSGRIDPTGELVGVSWIVVNQDGFLDYEVNHGFRIDLDTSVKISIKDDNPACLAMRLGKTQFFDFARAFNDFADITHKEELVPYSTLITIPINAETAIGAVFHGSKDSLIKYGEYFECLRLIVSLWFTRKNFERSALANTDHFLGSKMTPRQETILTMIKAGDTNSHIAVSMGYSESLIRQETIIIYRKLGVEGRKGILARTLHDEST